MSAAWKRTIKLMLALALVLPGLAQASMTGRYRQITPQQLDEMKHVPARVAEILISQPQEPGMAIDVDKAWHGLHYVVTGTAQGGHAPLSMAVLGGTEIGGDVGYGPAKYLTPEEVKEVAKALAGLDEAALRAKFNPKAMADAKVYPEDLWEGEDDAFEYLLENFAMLSIFFQDASARGNAVLFYLS